MIIGNLFVALGVKGNKKAIGAIGDVKKNLKETAGMGLEAKAAILGAVYALERMFAKSGQVGTDLTNFNATLGVSAKTLQQYQYAARQVGVSNEAVEGSFRSLQGSITKTLMGKGAPEGLARVAQVVAQIGKNMSPIDLEEFANDPSKLLQRLQEYAQLEQNAGLRNETLKSFGLGDDMVAALTRNAFKPEVMSKAPTYSDNEIAQLDKANIAWSNLGNKIQMSIGHLNAAHGGQLIKDISALADQVLRLSESFLKLAEKIKLFEGIGKVFEGWDIIFNGIGKGVDKVTKAFESDEGAEKLKNDFIDDTAEVGKYAFNESVNAVKGWFGDDEDNEQEHAPMPPKQKPAPGNAPSEKAPPAPGNFVQPSPLPDNVIPINGNAPTVEIPPSPVQSEPLTTAPAAQGVPPGAAVTGSAAAPAAAPTTISTQNNNLNVTQSLNFTHDGRDAKQTGDSVKRATQNALRQMPGLAQGS